MSFNTTVALSATVRQNLLTLNQTSALTNRTTGRLSTGLKVASVIDDAVSYFQSKSLNDRASDFSARKSAIDQGISSLTAALNATDAVDALLKQLKGIAQAAQSQSTAQQVSSSQQFYEIGRQISKLVNDASYQGLNLLNSSRNQLNVTFSEKSNSNFIQSGFHLNGTASGVSANLFTASTAFGTKATVFNAQNIFGGNNTTGTLKGFSAFATATSSGASAFLATVNVIDAAISHLRGVSSTIGSNVALLQTRLAFTTDYVNTLSGGAGKLTLADLNEEGANLVSLQTRQQLGIQALSFAGQQQQGVLRLFG